MTRIFPLERRSSGVLLHPTSLPGGHGTGDLGPEARRFADALALAGQSWWQMLPVGPPGPGNSPYNSSSAVAGSPLLVSLDALVPDGWLSASDVHSLVLFPTARADYRAAARFKTARLEKAFAAFERRGAAPGFEAFRETNADWLEDFALFSALQEAHAGASWLRWEPGLRTRQQAALARARSHLKTRLRYHIFVQWLFQRQWGELKAHCASRGLGLIGDVPIYVFLESADVWAHQDLFQLRRDGRPEYVSGVPPDSFSRTGQFWGNPLYRWDVLKEHGYDWWTARMRKAFERFDAVRLDHFIGFARYWAVPGSARIARNGRWVPGPGADLFERLLKVLEDPVFIAEDLGAVGPDVTLLRDRFKIPGMRLLHWAFGDRPEENLHHPRNHVRRCAVYTGTHDNDTTAGWFRRLAPQKQELVLKETGAGPTDIHWGLIRLALSSPADTALVPAQDLLGLGSSARMNLPASRSGNWQWRLKPGALTQDVLQRLRRQSEETTRVAASAATRKQAV